MDGPLYFLIRWEGGQFFWEGSFFLGVRLSKMFLRFAPIPLRIFVFLLSCVWIFLVNFLFPLAHQEYNGPFHILWGKCRSDVLKVFKITRALKCIWHIFFICSIKSPQCTDMYSEEKFSIAIFLRRVLMYQKRQISLPVRYKAARSKRGDRVWLWRHFRTSSLAKNSFPSHFLIVS